MTRKTLFALARGVVSFLLVLVALYSAGLLEADGWRQASKTVSGAHLGFLLASVLCIPLMDIVSTVKWKALVAARGISISFMRLLAFYIVGRFYNLVLPSSIGGDVIRIFLLGKYSGRQADAAGIVFVERFTGVIVLLVLAAISLLFTGLGLSRSTLLAGVVLATVAIGGFFWILVDPRPMEAISQWFGGKAKLLDKVLAKVGKLRVAILAFRHHDTALWTAFLNSLVFYFFAIINVWVSVMVFDQSVSLTNMMIAVPLIMFIMNIPISIGSIGIMEFGYTVVLMQFGVDGDAAIATALLMRLKLLLAGVFGAAVYSLMGDARPDVEQISAIKPG